MTSNQQDPLRQLFEAWASLNLPRSYSLALEAGDYDEATRVAFSAFKAGLRAATKQTSPAPAATGQDGAK